MVHNLLQLDRQLLVWINSHHNLALDVVLAPVSLAGECGAIWVVLGLALLIFGRGRARWTGLVLLVTMLVVDRLIAAQLAHWVYRTRPYLAMEGVRQLGVTWKGSSFPSGHAHSVCIAAIILSRQWPRLRWPLIAFAVLSCYARPYLGMHYPSDVMAGVGLGVIGGMVAVRIGGRGGGPGRGLAPGHRSSVMRSPSSTRARSRSERRPSLLSSRARSMVCSCSHLT